MSVLSKDLIDRRLYVFMGVWLFFIFCNIKHIMCMYRPLTYISHLKNYKNEKYSYL